MVRRKQTSTLSPTKLKHFAGAAVIITGLLALFASGEEWGANAQIEAIEAKNRLAMAEQEKLGTRKLKANLKVRNKSSMTMGDVGGDGIDGGDGGGSYGPEIAKYDDQGPVSAGGAFVAPPPMPNQPGASVTVSNQDLDSLPPGAVPTKMRKNRRKGPSAQELQDAQRLAVEPSGNE